MNAPEKTVKSLEQMEAKSPGGDAFVFPDMPDVVSGWMQLATANLQTWQDEMTRFMGRRLERDRLTLQKFASCSNVLDAAKVQQDWFAEALADYLDEGRRLTVLGPDLDMAGTKKKSAAKTKLEDVA